MKTYILFLFALLTVCLTSCDDWLDVRAGNTIKEEDQFRTYKGFRDALTGCYMAMADQKTYGQRMTMTTVELLANLWYCPEENKTQTPEYYYLTTHSYTQDAVLTPIDEIYRGLFNTIAQANVIIKHAEAEGEAINDEKTRATITGEAYAIRAYCQLDVLRLFGQLPQGGSKQVSLPYSYVTGINEMPSYYAFDDYVTLLKADIDKALSLLEDNDPIFQYTFEDLNSPTTTLMEDSYFYYRQFRLNYWAVKALQARMYLYLGENNNAYKAAMSVINAKGIDGNPIMELSGLTDMGANRFACPSECLFYLSKYDINTYANNVLVGGNWGLDWQITSRYLYLTEDMLHQLYLSIASSTGSHNRYNNIWNRQAKAPSGAICPTLKKYWYSEETTNDLMLKHQIIPMLRMSEIYLIAIETTTSLTEANSLYTTYMRSCAVSNHSTFGSTNEVKEEIINEYRRELFGEGQMFYTYKRINSAKMLWKAEEVQEDEYIVPLPQTEYNPNN